MSWRYAESDVDFMLSAGNVVLIDFNDDPKLGTIGPVDN